MKDKHQASPTPEEIIQEICNRYNRLKESSSADIKLSKLWQESFSLIDRKFFEEVLIKLEEADLVIVSISNDTIRLTERGIGHCKGIRG
jgi:hypothetical protein